MERQYNYLDDRLPSFTLWKDRINLFWSYYNGSIFDLNKKQRNFIRKYLKDNGLYRYTRYLYNPARNAVNFYVSTVYGGTLSLNDYLNSAMPIITPNEQLKKAIKQLWQWSNFQKQKNEIVKIGCATGNVLVEIIDDLERRKVYSKIITPDNVKSISIDTVGNVKAYTIEYIALDKNNEAYLFTKSVDKNWYKIYIDGELVEEESNTYGFCPAIWIVNDGCGVMGTPCYDAAIAPIDEVNSQLSHLADMTHKIIESPMILWTDGSITDAIGQSKQQLSRAKDNEYSVTGETTANDYKQQHLILKGEKDGRVDTLVSNAPISFSFQLVQELVLHIKELLPEISFFRDLRTQFSQITGIAVENLISDVKQRVEEVQATYDVQIIKLFQMMVAIAGSKVEKWKLIQGGNLTNQQEYFSGFDLTSYNNGELNFEIGIRPILKPTQKEISETRVAYWNGIEVANASGVPIELLLKQDGFSDDTIQAIVSNRANNKITTNVANQ